MQGKVDQTRADQSEQARTELNENSPAWSRATSTRPMQTTANKQDLGKAEQIKQDQIRTRYIRTTKPEQYGSCQISTDRNAQTEKSKTNQLAETEQTIRNHTRNTKSKDADKTTGQQTRWITTDQTNARTISPHVGIHEIECKK